jgi:hypothetical protein
MKKILHLFFISYLFLLSAIAQNANQGMKYQAVARDLLGNELINEPIEIKIQLVSGEKNTKAYYSETHKVVTNEFGLFSLNIGEGTTLNGNFKNIPWSEENIWMELSLKESNGYEIVSKTKLLAVPYAYYANTAGNLSANENNNVKPVNGFGPLNGVPSQNWSLFGNSKTDPEKDKLGTTDYTDLIFVTDNLERLKITAEGEVQIKGDLNLEKDLRVGENVYLNVKDTDTGRGQTINYGKFTSNGQVTINPNLTGNDTDYDAHALRIEGTNQGVAIKLNKEKPDNDNNFITFFNNKGEAVGRIEGETKNEKESSQEYIWEEGILIAEEVVAATNTGLSFIPVCTGGFIVSCGVDWGGVAMAAADLVLASLNLDNFYDFADANYGVTYQSGSADYAEWLERINPNEILTSGDIVGVFGGKISKYTKNAQQYMVISTKPAILGNMPREGQEKLYEKVAFMGQIPVKVRGPVMSGDYIIPSGLNDGIGRSVSSDEIRAEQYREIVGVAWSSSLFNEGVSTINMAIGLNTNDVSKLVAQLEAKYNSLEARIAALENRDAISQKYDTKEEEEKTRYEIAIENMPPELDDEIMEEAMTYLKNAFQINGIDIEDNPILHKLYTDPTYKAKIIKETQERYKITYQKYLEMLKAEN